MASFVSVGEREQLHGLRWEEAESSPAREMRSTILLSSLASARKYGRFDAYLKGVASEHRAAILGVAPGTWVPIATAEAHYTALDGCGFSNGEMVKIGEETLSRLDGSPLGGAVSVIRNLGATPWTVLAACPALFERTFVGGGIGIFKVGPKDAQVEIRGLSLIKHVYFREAWRGLFREGLRRFSTRMFVEEMVDRRTAARWALRISWV